MRTNVYVDGFNLYYGCLKGSRFKWLDLGRLCALLLPNYQISRIRYFTAKVRPRPDDPQKHIRQMVYLRALQTIPNLSIHYGHYLSHTVRMPLAHPRPGGPGTVEVIKTEEKGADVNIATHLLVDGFQDDYQAAVVISNDSDLRAPIEIVRAVLDRPVIILNPYNNGSQALMSVASTYKQIRTGVLQASQFPHTLKDQHGTIVKPPEW